MTSMNTIKRFQTELIVALFLILIIFAVFGQVVNHEFILGYDDKDYITENSHIQAGFTKENIQWAFTSTVHGQWHPVTWLSHMADVQLFGISSRGHHLTSLLIHVANTLLLFFLFFRITGAPLRSGVVAILFALHPIHVEPVSMVSYRKDLLCAFFMMLCFHAYVNFAKTGGVVRYGLVMVLFIVGLMAKAVIVPLPFLLLLLDYWPLCRFTKNQQLPETNIPHSFLPSAYKRKSSFSLVLEKIGLFVPMMIIAIIVIIVRNPDKSIMRLPSWHHISNGIVSYVLYLGKTLLPVNFSVIYPSPRFLLWQVVLSGFILLLVTGIVLWKRKEHPYLVSGWGWYLISFLPVIGILGFMGPHTMADRYAYIPVVGLFIMAAWGLPHSILNVSFINKIYKPAAGILVAVMMSLSWFQAGVWKNDITLFSHAVRVTSGNIKAHINLGLSLYSQGKYQQALYHFFQVLQFRPDHVPAHVNIGNIYDKLGGLKKAEFHFAEVLRISPKSALGHNGMGIILDKKGQVDEALDHFKKAVVLQPNKAGMHYNLGVALVMKGKTSEGIAHFSTAIRINPQLKKAYLAKGYALGLMGK